MTMHLSQRTHYERLPNGADVYLLQTATKDVVVCKMAFPGGVYATYNKQSVALLLDDLLPGSTKKKKRSTVLEQFEILGAQMSVHTAHDVLVVTLMSRSTVFLEVFRLAVEVLTTPVFAKPEYAEAHARLENSFKHALEDTRIQANSVLMRALYQKGHPHWIPSTTQFLSELRTTTRDEVQTFYKDTLSSVGAVVCVVGDIHPNKLLLSLRDVLEQLPSKVSKQVPTLQVNRVATAPHVDTIRTIRDKRSVDTVFAIPVVMTREHHAYLALQTGVSILGASSNSRLFSALRTKNNLTYDAHAAFSGFSEGYPGYLSGYAIFPNTVFVEGRAALKETVQHFIEKGVTKKELEERKEQVAGRFKVGLSTTRGLCVTLFSTLLEGKSTAYLDTYVERVAALSLKEVNASIKEQLDFSLIKTVSAGAIDQEGNPV